MLTHKPHCVYVALWSFVCLSPTQCRNFSRVPAPVGCLTVLEKGRGSPTHILQEQESTLLHEPPCFTDHWLLAPKQGLPQSSSSPLSHHPPSPPIPNLLLWSRGLSCETLEALLITGELTGRGGEIYMLSQGEEKGDQERKVSVVNFPAPAPELSGFPGSWTCKVLEWERAKKSYGKADGREGKWLTLPSDHRFWRGLQNSEMCLLFNVGKLTRNRYRGSMTLTAFDTGDGPLVGTNSPSAETDYFMCLLSWEPTFANILMPKLAHLSIYWFIWRQIGVQKQLVGRTLQWCRGWR